MWLEYKFGKKIYPRLYGRKDFWANIILGLGGIASGAVSSMYMLSIYYGSYFFFEPVRQAYLGYDYLGWGIGIWLLAVVADDFSYYWFHRSGHMIRVMWAAHVVHHSSEHFNLSTAVRLAWVSALYKPFLWVWMTAIGFHPLMVLTCVGMSTIYQFFCHTRFAPLWDRFSWILNTPGLHAVHHGKDDHCIDKNFGGVFIFFDKIFGTYAPPLEIRDIHFGVTRPPLSDHPWEISSHEFKALFRDLKQSRSWSERWQYLFRTPGWKP
jgi:sterol desaturase/sphingolipid hydroxylase (fatty acid hydroxylase superfamily)